MWLINLLDPGQIRYRAVYTHPNQIPGYASACCQLSSANHASRPIYLSIYLLVNYTVYTLVKSYTVAVTNRKCIANSSAQNKNIAFVKLNIQQHWAIKNV